MHRPVQRNIPQRWCMVIRNVDITNRTIQLKHNFGELEIGMMYKKSLKEMFH